MGWYKEIIKKVSRIDQEYLELKKDIVWEGDEQQWCIIVHGIRSEKEKINFLIRQMKISTQVILNMYCFPTIQNKKD